MITEVQDVDVTLADLDAAVAALEAAATIASNNAQRADDLIGAVVDLRSLVTRANDAACRITQVTHAIEARISSLRDHERDAQRAA